MLSLHTLWSRRVYSALADVGVVGGSRGAERSGERRTSSMRRHAGGGEYTSHEVSIETLLQGSRLHTRVDWDGDPSSLGSFEILKRGPAWTSCQDRPGDDPARDFIFSTDDVKDKIFRVCIERGPDHPQRQIAAKAIPVSWSQSDKPIALAGDPDYVALRAADYIHYRGADTVSWRHSTLKRGIHTVTLDLVMRQFDGMRIDYLIWIKLQHPERDDTWLIQDPVLRPPVGAPVHVRV